MRVKYFDESFRIRIMVFGHFCEWQGKEEFGATIVSMVFWCEAHFRIYSLFMIPFLVCFSN
jgi:hypothetical protein